MRRQRSLEGAELLLLLDLLPLNTRTRTSSRNRIREGEALDNLARLRRSMPTAPGAEPVERGSDCRGYTRMSWRKRYVTAHRLARHDHRLDAEAARYTGVS